MNDEPRQRAARSIARSPEAYPVRVLVVDDSAFMRKAISLMLASDPTIEVVGTARDGQDAIEKVKQLTPDVVTLDIEMPEMDGLTALKKLKADLGEKMPAILMCSTLTSAGSHAALRAMEYGASDFICKDPQSFGVGAERAKVDLLAKVKAVGERVQRQRMPWKAPRSAAPLPATPLGPGAGLDLSSRRMDLVVIGSSTGGPPVLETILKELPPDFPCPVVIAQHMPRAFTLSMSQRLDDLCTIAVHHGEHGMPVVPGVAYILPGGLHGRVLRRGKSLVLDISEEPKEALYRPSANELFRSAAEAVGAATVGVMLTGMGDDGLVGAKALHATGAPIVAQDAETCVVYGMPRAVTEAGLVSASLPPTAIGKVLGRLRSMADTKAA